MTQLEQPQGKPPVSKWIQSLTRRPFLLLGLVVLAGLLPFITKPFHVDDPLFLKVGQQIQTHPTDPFGFMVNWNQQDKLMADVTKNPPLASYYIALVAAVAGWSELALHLAFILPALAAVFGVFCLARMLCGHPLLASMTAFCTPVFLVSSTTVMCDVMMLAFWVWAMVFWIWGRERKQWLWLAGSATLVTAATMTKYFGGCLILLLLVYSLIKERRLGWWALNFLIPLLLLAGYEWQTSALYGRGLLLDAAGYSSRVRESPLKLSPFTLLAGLAYTGGCLAVVLAYVPLLWRRRIWIPAGLCVGLTAMFLFYVTAPSPLVLKLPGRALDLVSVQVGLWVCGGVALLALAAADVGRRRDANAWLLLLWVFGTFVFAVLVNWTINARSFLPLAPAAGILLVRRLEDRAAFPGGAFTWRAAWPLVVAAADFVWARTAREGAMKIQQACPPLRGTLWFQGHWGFQHYMESFGARAMDRWRSVVQKGDRLVIPMNNCCLFTPTAELLGVSPVIAIPRPRWLSTMNQSVGAGFYASEWGPLPFAVGKVSPEEFYLCEIGPPPSEQPLMDPGK